MGLRDVAQLNNAFKSALSELDGATIDCSSFTPIYDIGSLKMAEDSDGLQHVLEFHGRDGLYQGTTPFMVQRNALGFLQREAGIADAKRRGWKPR